MKTIHSECDLDALRRTSMAYAAVGAWSDLGLFARLAESGPTALAQLPGDERGLAATANVLVALGLLWREGGTVGLTPAAEALWEGGALRDVRARDTFRWLSRLDELVEHGGPIADRDGVKRGTHGGVRDDDPAASRAFLDRLYRRSAVDAPLVARWLDTRLPRGARVLDLGGGHGRYAEELAARGHRAVLFDRPVAVAVARDRYGERLEYIEGDFFDADLGGPYDAVFLSNIVHCFGTEQIEALFGRIARALAPGGRLVVKDMLAAEESLPAPDSAACFGLIMLMATHTGRVWTVAELARAARKAGLDPHSHEQPARPASIRVRRSSSPTAATRSPRQSCCAEAPAGVAPFAGLPKACGG